MPFKNWPPVPKKALPGMVTKVTALAVTVKACEKLPSAMVTLPVVDISDVIYNIMLLGVVVPVGGSI